MSYIHNAANLVNVKVHLSWHLQLHSKMATSSPDARRKINLTCEVPEDKHERTEECMLPLSIGQSSNLFTNTTLVHASVLTQCHDRM